jgi:hypothetical protein
MRLAKLDDLYKLVNLKRMILMRSKNDNLMERGLWFAQHSC